ncbi:hypothetical protein, partial [Escherichia coli]|uniref:hypothetical protein n=1 Tax=Escherichia coli TaxID=562 RepID=UPI001E2E6526
QQGSTVHEELSRARRPGSGVERCTPIRYTKLEKQVLCHSAVPWTDAVSAAPNAPAWCGMRRYGARVALEWEWRTAPDAD